jgi:predicted ATPase/class 3 adenylate cyclase
MTGRPELPRGTVTLLAADVDDAPRIAASLGAEHAGVLARYRSAMQEAVERHEGVDVDSHGETVLAAFGRARDAASAAADALAAIRLVALPDGSTLPVRIGIHSGEPTLTETGYIGLDVHRAARICSAAMRGQIVLSQSTQSLVGHLPVRDLGEHRLRDLARPERLYELITGAPASVDDGRVGGAALRPTPTGLPVPPTRIVGREDDHRRVAALLRGIDNRVVTLTGAGGIGKTRLAVDVASELADYFPDGVYWVSLSPVTEGSLIPSVVARAIGAPSEGEGLNRHLRDRALLLLLDNLEQIPDAGEEVASLLAAGPRVRVLATSRRPLHVSGEAEVALEPLELPAAVELFLDRARAVRPNVDRDADVEAICTRLDGMPLALELVAPQLRHLAASQLGDRLDRALDIASRGSDLPERQRTLRATIEWSVRLLDDNARTVLERLAVFSASCTLAAAEAVVTTPDVSVLDGIQALADASLLRLSVAPQSTSEPRYFMFETVREYALDRLREDGREQEFRRRHAEWFLRLTTDVRAVATLTGIAEIHADRANLRSALGWALAEEGDNTLGFRLAFGVWRYWAETGSIGEARRWLDLALATPHEVDAALETRALDVSAFLAYHQGDLEHAWRTNDEAIRRARLLTDRRRVLGWASLRAAEMAQGAGHFDRVGTHLEEAIAAFEEASYALALAWCHAEKYLGELLACRFDGAREGFIKVVAESELLDELDPWAYAKVCLGSAIALGGDGRAALPHLETGIETLVDLDARFTLVSASLQAAPAFARIGEPRHERMTLMTGLRIALEGEIVPLGVGLVDGTARHLATVDPGLAEQLWSAADAACERHGLAYAPLWVRLRADARRGAAAVPDAVVADAAQNTPASWSTPQAIRVALDALEGL